MPNCVQFYRHGSKQAASFHDIDKAICHNLDLPFSDTLWVESWYDIIAFRVAMGSSLEKVGDYLKEQARVIDRWQESYRKLICINHFLIENYTTDSWVEIGRR